MQLIRWSYTEEEWKKFQQWNTPGKGALLLLLRKLWPVRRPQAAVIEITTDQVRINGTQEPFHNHQRRIRQISIREAGSINILEICYEQGNMVRGIRVPIPKGKLKEAFEVQSRLTKG